MDKFNFNDPCPLCGAQDHKKYEYRGAIVFACPNAPEDKIVCFECRPPKEKAYLELKKEETKDGQ